MRENPYKGGQTQRSVVVFLDILGFSSAIADARKQSNEDRLLSQLQAALKEARPYLDDRLSESDLDEGIWESRFFTDNLVIGMPIFLDAEGELGNSFLLAGLYQYVLIKHGFFVRGAISVGQLFMDEDVVFGSGLLEAHDAESTLARDPRIVLAPSALKYVQNHLCYYAGVDETPHDSYLLEDVDNQVFLNYLWIPRDDEEDPDPDYWIGLKNHKTQIEENLARYRDDPKIWSKYAWAANYHNFTCEAVCREDKSFWIGADFLQPHPRWLHEVYERKGLDLVRLDSGVTIASYRNIFRRVTRK